jgi:hypothetical protein
MPMTALVLVFCLQATPTSCTEQRPLENLSLRVCLMSGEQYASEWLAEHPKWTLSRWQCEQNVPRRRPA